MAVIVEYCPDCTFVPNRVLKIIRSANTPEYQSGHTEFIGGNYLINPDISAIDGIIPIKYWKTTGTTVIEMSQAEKDIMDENYVEKNIRLVKRNIR